MKLRPHLRRSPRVQQQIVVAPAAGADAYRELRRAEIARIHEVGDMVALGRPGEAHRAFAAAIAIHQELRG